MRGCTSCRTKNSGQDVAGRVGVDTEMSMSSEWSWRSVSRADGVHNGSRVRDSIGRVGGVLSGPSADGLEGVEGGREVLEAGPVDFVEVVGTHVKGFEAVGEGPGWSWEGCGTSSDAIVGVSEAAEAAGEAPGKKSRMSC